MKNRSQMGIVLGGCAVVMVTSLALAQDWPQWRGPNRDAKVAGFTVPKTWPKELTQKWRVTVGQGDATPALVGDRLYVFARQGGDEINLCIDAKIGKELWQDKYAAPTITGGPGSHAGPRSSPVVADGKVITLGVGGILSCLDAGSGKLLWRKDDFPGAWPKFYTAMSPIVVDGLCIAHLGKEGDGALVAYDLAGGNVKWKWAGEGPSYASPILVTVENTKIIVTQTEKSLVGVAVADGKLLWQIPFVPQGMGTNVVTPIVEGRTIIYAGQEGHGTKALEIEKQAEGFVVKELWSNPENTIKFGTPVLKNGFLFGLSQNGILFCVNAKTGQSVWTNPVGERGGFGSIVDAGAVLLILTPKSQLVVIEPSDKEYKELARFKVADTQTYAYPIVTGDRIYVKDQDSVTLWTVE